MRRLLAFAPLLAAGCGITHEPTPLEFDRTFISLHAVLVSGEERAAVLLTRATPSDVAYLPHRVEPVPGATVLLSGAGQTFVLQPSNAAPDACGRSELPHPSLSPACYVATIPGGIRAGVSYTLEATLPDGGQVHGEATIPAPPAVRTSEPNPILVTASFGTGQDEQEAVAVSWDPLPARGVTTLSIRLEDRDCEVWVRTGEASAVASLDVTGRSSIGVRAQQVFCIDGPAEGTHAARLRVVHYDDSYSAYLATTDDASTPVEQLSWGLTGAAGVFAGAGASDIAVTVVQRGPPD